MFKVKKRVVSGGDISVSGVSSFLCNYRMNDISVWFIYLKRKE